MPHICTRCNSVFDSGEDILKGCPACGWKKFMFLKDTSRKDGQQEAQEQIITQAMGVKRPPGRRGRSEAEESPAGPALGVAVRSHPGREDHDSNAISSNSPGELKKADLAKADPKKDSVDSGSREENALESVKITGPGTYELNLPSLFERDELIMAVKEGTYYIDLHLPLKS